MRLYWSSRSPFVRKVMVVAHEKNLAGGIELERVAVGASAPNAAVMRDNPLSRIPTLVLDDGAVLYDSRVICQFLDESGTGPSLFPAGPDRWTALRLQALGDGLMEVLVLRIGENNRPEAIRSAPHQAALPVKIAATLDRLETEAPALSGPPHIGAIAVAVALSHLEFRFASDDWRRNRPALASWHAAFADRAAMQATAFRDEY